MEISLHEVPTSVFDRVTRALFELRFQGHHVAMEAINEKTSTIRSCVMLTCATRYFFTSWEFD